MSYKRKARKKAKKVLGIIGMVVGGIALLVLASFAVMWLWNWLMPELFGLTTITYWQGLGIAVLGRLIFGGFGGGDKDKDKHDEDEDCDTVRGQIKKEIAKEIDKEFDKEFDKTYDAWWEKEGKKSYEAYAENKKEAE